MRFFVYGSMAADAGAMSPERYAIMEAVSGTLPQVRSVTDGLSMGARRS